MNLRPAPTLALVVCGCVLAASCARPPGRARTASPAPEAVAQAGSVSESLPVVTTVLYALDKNGFPTTLPPTAAEARAKVFVPANAWEELDDIYGLMALAIVHADWQEGVASASRGHNIGGVIVNPDLEVVNWERNSNDAMCNGTQHGEVRTMLKQLNLTGARTLRQYQIYTSLEPCMMCSGMMMQQELLRTVYMQTDNTFGKNIERLTIDTSASPIRFDGAPAGRDGYPPAARPVISSMSSSEFRLELDTAWRAASPTASAGLTGWLKSDEAEDIYRRARRKFENYPLRFGGEKAVVKFVVPEGATKPKEKFPVLRASKTNAELYAAALRFFNDPALDVIPYVAAGNGTLVESKDNVLATRLLEDPTALVRAEHPRGSAIPKVPGTELLVVDGTLNGTHVHQERVRRDCR